MKEAIFHPSADARLHAPALTAALSTGTGGTVGKPGLENSPVAAIPAGFSGTLDAECWMLDGAFFLFLTSNTKAAIVVMFSLAMRMC